MSERAGRCRCLRADRTVAQLQDMEVLVLVLVLRKHSPWRRESLRCFGVSGRLEYVSSRIAFRIVRRC